MRLIRKREREWQKENPLFSPRVAIREKRNMREKNERKNILGEGSWIAVKRRKGSPKRAYVGDDVS